eukprot:GAHX01002467.1.p1 GENE.GAHX01002467.1~~GAHX01002467.1.p1  ORF type:complete len:255 (+),score=22.53 GAHX01002467.1:262-1026(+)
MEFITKETKASANTLKTSSTQQHPFEHLIYKCCKFPISLLLRSCMFILMFYCLISTFVEGFYNFIYLSYWTLLFMVIFLGLILSIEICYITNNEEKVTNDLLFEFVYRSVMIYCLLVSLLMIIAFYGFIRSKVYPTYKDRMHFVVTNEIVHGVFFVYIWTEFFLQKIRYKFKDLFLITVIGNMYIVVHIIIKLNYCGFIYPGFLDFQQNVYASFFSFIGIYMIEVVLGVGLVLMNETAKKVLLFILDVFSKVTK